MAKTAPEGSRDLARVAKAAFWTYVVALVIQAAHFVEHIAQIHQFVWLADPRPKGLFGSVFDFAWVHFAYNAGIFVAIVWCYALWLSNRSIWRPSKWGAFWFHSLVAFQGYHVVEHTIQMYQYYRYNLLVPPGWIGQHVPNLIAHFDINGIMTLQMLVVLLVFQPFPRPHGPAAPKREGLLARLPGGFRSGVVGSGGVAVFLVLLIVVFANSAPAATTIPLAQQHCLGQPKTHAAPVDADWSFADASAAAGFSHVVAAGMPPMGRLGIAGVTSLTSRTETHPMKTLTGGLAVGDPDGDGWPDLLVTDYGPDVMYRNRGDGTFEDVTDRAGLADPEQGRAAVWFDFDADGDDDLFVTNLDAPARLWRNDGNWTFVDVAEEAGVAAPYSTPHSVSAVDVDGDGDLDLSVANYGPWFEVNAENNADARNGDRDLLFVNHGNGTFTEEAEARGLAESKWTFSHAWADVDRDGDQDLYVNNDFATDHLFLNDGTGRFADATAATGMHTDGNGMGAVWVDHDNDRDLDLFATAIYVACNRDVPQFAGNDLFENDGQGRFRDVSAETGIADGGWGWDSEWVDFDHDGDLDAYQANGFSTRGKVDRYHDAFTYLSDEAPKTLRSRNQGEEPSIAYQKYNASKYVIWSFYPPLSKTEVDESSQGGHQVDRLWLNDGGRFADASASVGFTEWTDSRAAVAIDFDRDGDMDLVRTAFHEPLQLFENFAAGNPNAGHWLQVELRGKAPNTDAYGATVEVVAGDLSTVRLLAAGGGFLSQSEPLVHVGLGERAVADEVVVTWPDGSVTRLTDVPAGGRLVLQQP